MAFSEMKNIKRSQVVTNPDCDTDGSDSDSTVSIAETGNAAWADSIAKVLNTTKPKSKKVLVLSRAKKAKPNEKSQLIKNYDFEIDCEVKDETSNIKPIKSELDEKLKHRKNVQLSLRVKPTWQDIERERTLRKVATRGVVQLFNAVRIQQKDIEHKLEEAGPLDSRKDAVLHNINKKKFLDVLMSGNRAKSETVDNQVKEEFKEDLDSSDENGHESSDGNTSNNKKKSKWNVLSEDFMTNKKNKHWDEEEDDSENSFDNTSENDHSD